MSISIDPGIEGRLLDRHRYVRPVALLILLVAEALCFTIRFEAPRGLPTQLWWGSILWNSRFIVRWILLMAVAVAAFGGVRFAARMRRAFFYDSEENRSWPVWFFAHGLLLLGFAGLTSFVCEGNLVGSPRPDLWVLAWLVTGLGLGATWLSAVLAPSAWLEVIGRSKRSLAFGVAVSAVAYRAGDYTSHLWSTMADATFGLVRAMLGLIASDVVCEPAKMTIAVGGFQVRVHSACAGFEGIGLVLVFLSAYLWCFRRSLRWPRAYWILPMGVGVIWLLNATRIVTLILIGAWVSPEVAFGGFHSQAGWMAFLAVSLGLVAATRRSSFFAAGVRSLDVPGSSNPTLSFLGPFLALVATAMVTGMFSPGFDAFYGLRVLTGGFALWYFRDELVGALRGFSWAGVAIGVVAFALWLALEPAASAGSASLASSVWALPVDQARAWITLRVIGSVAIVPLAEELAFRGYLTRRLISVDFESVPMGRFTWISLIVSSVAFGFLHGRWLAGMLVGLLYALAMYRRGKLGDAVLAHAVTNALIAATVLTSGDWSMWA